MEISLNPSGIKNWDGSILILGLYEGKIEEQLNKYEHPHQETLVKELQKINFKAKTGEVTKFQLLGQTPAQVILVGLGEPKALLLDDLRKAASIGARASFGSSGKLGIMLPWNQFDSETTALAVGEALRLSLFKDLRFRNNPDPILRPEALELLGVRIESKKVLERVTPICAGVELARELVGSPPNSLTPKALAEQAVQIANEYGLESIILGAEECKERGMGAYLAVAQGSDMAPQFIHLIYRPDGPVKRRLAMVGKGLTFDSGGYNLKVGAAQIEMMKFDMGGSAAVIGAARALAELRPKDIEVHFIVAACENMINGSAVHPGDIVQASNGKTIEINNTDAEGRLTLADALIYACELEPDAIVDLATLTGACVIALGDEIAGLWTDDDELAMELIEAADSTGEGLWRMPLRSSYKEGLKSMLADIKNTGPRAGGSITAGLFLKEFVKESIPWAHIDIAGTVWTDKDRGINPAGATGYGVRTLVNWACKPLGESNQALNKKK
ncbi:leucyl aminopeptidase [Prochlorococcus sp. MIT 1307]|uniref:leucyl aminopeptidase n=1 Tax=Prochlorococcus sp. MIT 1307 TaxID=3096219 RepID=UPI002A74F767|nr:leucyl aminopeptidase [Prochlorococcus sp. MIT 1307]